MEYEKIKQLMDDMSDSKLTELEIEFPEGIKISMKKENTNKVVEKKVLDSSKNENTLEKEMIESKESTKNINIVKSPMVGTFYLKPSPTSSPYVEIGKEVKKGDTLCIIEAMKLMNEIESEYAGIVKEVLIKDGDPVEFGTELFIIE